MREGVYYYSWWNEKETNRLKSLAAKGLTITEIKRHFPYRTKKSVECKLRRLGLCAKNIENHL